VYIKNFELSKDLLPKTVSILKYLIWT